ncbi:MAG: family 2 glycosyl transferase [Segetibacter sp.]|nr:family 2 glycosyl transferase [Segetibacter sp.]
MSTLALCIPAYNAEWSLNALFSSIRKQAIPFNEILLYNDCSTDNTAGMAEEFGAVVINGDKNKGCSYGKNQLAAIAKSDWLFFIDSDDELLPNFSEVTSKWINCREAPGLVLLGYSYVNFKTGAIKYEPKYDREALLKNQLRFMIKNKIVNSSLIRRDVFYSIGGFNLDPKILYVEDRAFSIKAAMTNIVFDIEPSVCFKINFFPESMSTAKPRRWLTASLYLWEELIKKVGPEYEEDICEQLFENAVWAAKYKCWNIVRKSLATAKRIKPDQQPKTSRLFLLVYNIFPVGAFYIREWVTKIIKRKSALIAL